MNTKQQGGKSRIVDENKQFCDKIQRKSKNKMKAQPVVVKKVLKAAFLQFDNFLKF